MTPRHTVGEHPGPHYYSRTVTDLDYVDLQELHRDGYIHEANRRFFHPLGLALALVTDDDRPPHLAVLDRRDGPSYQFTRDTLNSDKAIAIAQKAHKRWQDSDVPPWQFVQPVGGSGLGDGSALWPMELNGDQWDWLYDLLESRGLGFAKQMRMPEQQEG